ncbi:MAG: heme-binding protein [Xanthobacteraceae bacterium]|jgi:uncharacterized protein GlcG (DUF336 family)
MKICTFIAVLLATGLSVAGEAAAQQPPTPAANATDDVPEKMPNSTPYGAPISMQKAQQAMQAAVAESNRRGWQMSIAVVDSGAHLVAFTRMDGAHLGSIAVAQHKARAAAEYRRATRVFEDAAQKSAAVLALDDVIATRGGILLIEDGKIIGAIGCSSGAASQDDVVCAAGAATINK